MNTLLLYCHIVIAKLSFLGKKISVADVMVAVELLPLYHPNKALFAPRGHSLFTKDVATYPVKHVTRWFKAVCAT